MAIPGIAIVLMVRKASGIKTAVAPVVALL